LHFVLFYFALFYYTLLSLFLKITRENPFVLKRIGVENLILAPLHNLDPPVLYTVRCLRV
jgi:hypothetical protein